jgi:hypothetical protein
MWHAEDDVVDAVISELSVGSACLCDQGIQRHNEALTALTRIPLVSCVLLLDEVLKFFNAEQKLEGLDLLLIRDLLLRAHELLILLIEPCFLPLVHNMLKLNADIFRVRLSQKIDQIRRAGLC